MDINKENDNTMSLTDTAKTSEISMLTATTLKVNGIEYKAEYTTEGLKIPIPIYDSATGIHQAYYQLIPRSELTAMLTDLLGPDR